MYTLQQLTALESAITSGELEVKYADKSVKFQTLAEMRDLRQEMIRELTAAGLMPVVQSVRPTTSITTYVRD